MYEGGGLLKKLVATGKILQVKQ
jgi:hypothetical protein